MARIDDWLTYLEDPDAFPKDHFEPLITDTGTPLDLREAFGGLARGDALIERIEQVRRQTLFTGLYYVQDPERRLPAPALEARARKYCDHVSDFMTEIGMADLSRKIDGAEFAYLDVDDYDFRDADGSLGLNETGEVLDDEFTGALRRGPHYLFGLFQAVLFMTKVPVVTRYVMAPVVDFPLEETDGYQTWIGGAALTFGDRRAYLLLTPQPGPGV